MSALATYTLLVQVAATLAMVGLIWFVQIVHYPLFARVGPADFSRYEMDHQRLTSRVVVPLMLTELASAFLLIWWRPVGVGNFSIWLGIGLLAAIWLVTFTVQVPQHASLALSYDSDTQQSLVTGNWFRTMAWSARGVLVLWMVSQVIATDARVHRAGEKCITINKLTVSKNTSHREQRGRQETKKTAVVIKAWSLNLLGHENQQLINFIPDLL